MTFLIKKFFPIFVPSNSHFGWENGILMGKWDKKIFDWKGHIFRIFYFLTKILNIRFFYTNILILRLKLSIFTYFNDNIIIINNYISIFPNFKNFGSKIMEFWEYVYIIINNDNIIIKIFKNI